VRIQGPISVTRLWRAGNAGEVPRGKTDWDSGLWAMPPGVLLARLDADRYSAQQKLVVQH